MVGSKKTTRGSCLNKIVFLLIPSAPAAPPPKQMKLNELKKAQQTSIRSFTCLGGDLSKPLSINHPQVCTIFLNGQFSTKSFSLQSYCA